MLPIGQSSCCAANPHVYRCLIAADVSCATVYLNLLISSVCTGAVEVSLFSFAVTVFVSVCAVVLCLWFFPSLSTVVIPPPTHLSAMLWQLSDCRIEVAEAPRRTTFTSLRVSFREAEPTSRACTSSAVCLVCLHTQVCCLYIHVCLLHPTDLTHKSFSAAPYCLTITPH